MKIVAIFSGGLDSTTMVYDLLASGHEVKTLSVNYGQRHAKELQAANGIVHQLQIEHRIADLRSISAFLGGNSLTSTSVAVVDGHYTEETMKTTVVPNRNMIMLSVAAAWAISLQFDAVAFGAHGGDHAIYPDCRSEFSDAMDKVLQMADWHPVRLLRPFGKWTKADIVRQGNLLRVPFAETWSCYKGEELHCGTCGTCVERREAFHLAGVEDPTPYALSAPSTAKMVEGNWRAIT